MDAEGPHGKLIAEDKVDAVLGPYGTAFGSSAF
jgi:hypothetical protein